MQKKRKSNDKSEFDMFAVENIDLNIECERELYGKKKCTAYEKMRSNGKQPTDE